MDDRRRRKEEVQMSRLFITFCNQATSLCPLTSGTLSAQEHKGQNVSFLNKNFSLGIKFLFLPGCVFLSAQSLTTHLGMNMDSQHVSCLRQTPSSHIYKPPLL